MVMPFAKGLWTKNSKVNNIGVFDYTSNVKIIIFWIYLHSVDPSHKTIWKKKHNESMHRVASFFGFYATVKYLVDHHGYKAGTKIILDFWIRFMPTSKD